VALALAASGAKVVVNDYGVALDGSARRPDPRSTSARRSLPPRDAVATPSRCPSGTARGASFDTAIERFGRIDVLSPAPASCATDDLQHERGEWDAVWPCI